MKNNTRFISLLFLVLFLFGCGKESSDKRVIIGISADIESLNPLYSFSVDEGNITELLFLSLIKHSWNNDAGDLESSPMLAQEWQWAKDSSYIIIQLRNDVTWSDGVKTTPEDVIFSFDVYSDPAVQSRLYGTYKNFYTDKENHIDVKKTFEIVAPNKLKINFKVGTIPSLFDIDFPIIPKHIYEKYDRKNIQTARENFAPVTNGPFTFKKWDRNQSIRLIANKSSFLYKPQSIKELIFKIIPDYTSRINQLKSNEIDFTEDIKTDDIGELKKEGRFAIAPVKGREYDYVGWNNIDVEAYQKNKKIIKNKLFGDKLVRKALTMALNRKEILDEFLMNNGTLAYSPVTPIFIKSIDENLNPYDFDIKKSRELLNQAGWKDTDNDGILEKGNIKFSFKLFIPSGNPRREYAATIFNNNLKQIGVEASIEKVEMGVFIDNLYKKKYDAWMAGWSVPIPIDLKPYWYSDLEQAPLNFVSYQNIEVDAVITSLEKEKSVQKKNDLYKKFQRIIHDDEPVTFLYWIDNLVVYNKKVKNIEVNPFGAVHHCWDWSVQE